MVSCRAVASSKIYSIWNLEVYLMPVPPVVLFVQPWLLYYYSPQRCRSQQWNLRTQRYLKHFAVDKDGTLHPGGTKSRLFAEGFVVNFLGMATVSLGKVSIITVFPLQFYCVSAFITGFHHCVCKYCGRIKGKVWLSRSFPMIFVCSFFFFSGNRLFF